MKSWVWMAMLTATAACAGGSGGGTVDPAFDVSGSWSGALYDDGGVLIGTLEAEFATHHAHVSGACRTTMGSDCSEIFDVDGACDGSMLKMHSASGFHLSGTISDDGSRIAGTYACSSTSPCGFASGAFALDR